jgi:hypothetical protein
VQSLCTCAARSLSPSSMSTVGAPSIEFSHIFTSILIRQLIEFPYLHRLCCARSKERSGHDPMQLVHGNSDERAPCRQTLPIEATNDRD